jgi:hypothetical protein
MFRSWQSILTSKLTHNQVPSIQSDAGVAIACAEEDVEKSLLVLRDALPFEGGKSSEECEETRLWPLELDELNKSADDGVVNVLLKDRKVVLDQRLQDVARLKRITFSVK